jgi:acetolactate synthase-1/2/3 large subunit
MAEGARLWGGVDVILAVGTRFRLPRTFWGLRPGKSVLRIDLDPGQFGRGEAADVALHADAKDALAAVLQDLDCLGPSRPRRLEEISALMAPPRTGRRLNEARPRQRRRSGVRPLADP